MTSLAFMTGGSEASRGKHGDNRMAPAAPLAKTGRPRLDGQIAPGALPRLFPGVRA
jgi:hypothetical protein